MKKIILTTISIFLASINLNAQTIKSIYDDGLYYESGMYYKDVDNDMNKFEGTWVFENGNIKLTIVLQKRLQVYIGSPWNCYADEVIGGYKYEIGNTVIVNTIPDTNLSLSHYENTIGGSSIVSNNRPPACTNCVADERRLLLHWKEPLSPYIMNHMMLRYYEEFNQSYIEAKLFDEASYLPEGTTVLTTRLPLGTYIMAKQ